MIKFNYKLDYKNILFKPNDKRYRIGRGEQGVLLVRPYTNDICKHWRFKTLDEAKESASTIFNLYLKYKKQKDFVGMDMCRKFLEMGFTRPRRYANHRDGKKYDKNGWCNTTKRPLTCENENARIHKHARDKITSDEIYKL